VRGEAIGGSGAGWVGQRQHLEPVGNGLVVDAQGAGDAAQGKAIGREAYGLLFEAGVTALGLGAGPVNFVAVLALKALTASAFAANFAMATGGGAAGTGRGGSRHGPNLA